MAKKMSATKKILLVVAGFVVVLVLLGIGASFMGGGETALAVETSTVGERTITQLVTASGKVQPEVQVTISPDVSGEIIELPVEEGDYVEEGQLLARIEPEIYQQQLAQQRAAVQQQQAAVKSAEANLIQARAVRDRQKALYEKDAISISEYQKAQTSLEVAEANYQAARHALQSSQARLGQSQEQLNKTAIYAPMAGTVSMLNVERGERVVGTSQMAGTEIMQIARLDQMEMLVDVNENDVIHLALGDTAKLLIDAYPERTFVGIVSSIAHSARISGAGTQEQVTNFPVKIRVMGLGATAHGSPATAQTLEVASEEPTINLRPGMSGTADIRTETVTGALAVPIQAVTVRDFNRVQPVDEEAEVAAEEGDDPAAEEAEAEEVEADAAEANQTDGAEDEGADVSLMVEEDLREVVFVVEDGKARMREVQTGIADATHLVVAAGLEAGEEVIIGPYRAVSRTLEPGMAVNPGANPFLGN